MFSSPQFLFHGGQPGPLDDHALASRLSYFLWKTLPDAELVRLANDKKLTQPKVLTAQAERMLDEGVYYAACSDTHRPEDVPRVGEAIERLKDLVGEEETEELLSENPRRVLAGEVIL